MYCDMQRRCPTIHRPCQHCHQLQATREPPGVLQGQEVRSSRPTHKEDPCYPKKIDKGVLEALKDGDVWE